MRGPDGCVGGVGVGEEVLAGTTALEPGTLSKKVGVIWPRDVALREPIRRLATAITLEEVQDAIAYSLFYDDEEDRTAAKGY